MTVASTLNKNTYQGNGNVTAWPIKFSFDDESEIKVYLTNPSNITYSITKDFVVDVPNSQLIYPGYTDAPPVDAPPTLPTGWKITIQRVLPLTQEVDLTIGGPWNPDVIEKALDKSIKIQQQQQEVLDRCVKLDISDTTDPATFLQTINGAVANASLSASEAANTLVLATAQANAATVQANNAANSATESAASAVASANKAKIWAIILG